MPLACRSTLAGRCPIAAEMTVAGASRRRLLLAGLAAPALAGCSSPLPLALDERSAPAARSLLQDSADAHGLAAYRTLHDLNVSYAGEWRALVNRLQPALVDAGFRQGSQERLLPAQRLIAQLHRGPDGTKQVLRQAARAPADGVGTVQVQVNGEPAQDAERRQAAALVADGYALFLLGPLWLVDRAPAATLGGTEWIDDRLCDVLQLRLEPGLGLSTLDRAALYIDRQQRLMRRVRFTLDGLESTRGAIAEVDCLAPLRRHGIVWPTRFYERLLKPIPGLPVHEWRLTGLDIDRGYGADALAGAGFGGAAAAAAQPL